MLKIIMEILSFEIGYNKDKLYFKKLWSSFRSGFGKVLGHKEVSQGLVTPLRPKPLDQLVDLGEPECLDIDFNIGLDPILT